MLRSHASEMGIRAALFLALQPPGKLCPVHEIATGTGLPRPYLAKVMRQLVRAGLVRAFRGPGGGLELGRAPQAISLWAIVRATEGPAQPNWCVLGLDACSEERPCPLHPQWFHIREGIERLLRETTLATLAVGFRDTTRLNSERRMETVSESDGVSH